MATRYHGRDKVEYQGDLAQKKVREVEARDQRKILMIEKKVIAKVTTDAGDKGITESAKK
eukprot:4114662-Ditylum_brightwellii.AAC.1